MNNKKIERLDKVISNMGFGSRSQIKKDIRDGFVKVNGEHVTKNGVRVKPYVDEIIYKGIKVEYREFIYLMMNKPQDYVSSTDDPVSPTVIDLLEWEHQIFEPFPAGRLDKDTEGLLLITNDGKLAHNLLSPNKRVEKVYYAKIDGCVNEDTVKSFNEGLTLDDGYETLPAKLDIIKSDIISEVYVTIEEGKYHQVKRMFGAVGMKVNFLKRVRMGTLELDDWLQPGEYRELYDEELEELKMI